MSKKLLKLLSRASGDITLMNFDYLHNSSHILNEDVIPSYDNFLFNLILIAGLNLVR